MAVRVRVKREKLVAAIKAFIADKEAEYKDAKARYEKSLESAVKDLKDDCEKWLKKTPRPVNAPYSNHPFAPKKPYGLDSAKQALKRLELSDEDYLELSDKDDYLSYL